MRALPIDPASAVVSYFTIWCGVTTPENINNDTDNDKHAGCRSEPPSHAYPHLFIVSDLNSHSLAED